MKNYRLHFVRHGMTEGNEQGRYIGSRTDSELSPRGIRELIDLRESYEYPAVGMVYSSPMTRCIQTAGIVYPDRPMTTVPLLREVDMGDFEGLTIEELQEREEYTDWLADALHSAPPNGESGEELLARVIEGLSFILRDMMLSDIHDAAIVSHGGVIMTLLAAVGMPRRPVQEWLVGNGRGYTCFVNPQMWQRDGIIEVAGIMPHGADTAMNFVFGDEEA